MTKPVSSSKFIILDKGEYKAFVDAAGLLESVCKELSSASAATAGLVPKAAIDSMLWKAADNAHPALEAYRKAKKGLTET